MQSVGRTTTARNVNKNCSFATKVFLNGVFKTMQDLIFLSHTSNFIDDEEFLVLPNLFDWKNSCFPYEDYSPFNLDEMTAISGCTL